MAVRKPKTLRALPDAALPLLARFSDPVREVVLALRGRILRVMPRAHEVVADVGYTVAIRFGSDARLGKCPVYIAGFGEHANLGFTQGAFLDDPSKVLDGDGAAMRHVKFGSVDEVARAQWLDAYLVAALSKAAIARTMGDAQTEVRIRSAKAKQSQTRVVKPREPRG
jgi:hypothetical protein